MANLSSHLPWDQANPRWASILNPLLALPILNGQQIDGIILTANLPMTIYHSLGQAPVGWFVVDQVANCYVKRTQPFSAKSITLEASADTTISIWVY